MKAAVYYAYGSPDRLAIKEIRTPDPTAEQVRIKIHAVSINGSDTEGLAGRPFYARFGGLFKPGNPVLGSDIAGVVESVGENHREFRVGDEIFGEIPGYHGGFAEYACTHGRTMMHKPDGMSFEDAAALPQGGVIALQGIREKGQVQPGQKVLINGAGGSAGTFAIQLARLYGAQVTGIDNAFKQDFMRTLGADHTIDYTRQDYTRTGPYDLVLDLIAHRSVFKIPRALAPGGKYFLVGGRFSSLVQVLLLGPLIGRRTGKSIQMLGVPQNRKDLAAITELVVAGKVAPVIDKVYPFDQIPDAMRYVTEGRARGKIVITTGALP